MTRAQAGPIKPRALGLPTLLALGVNGTVGVGIFFAPAEVIALVPGLYGALVYPLAALCLLPIAIVFGRLGRDFPEDGGPYIWARAAFGPSVGFALGWLTYVSSVLSAAAVVSGIGQQLKRPLSLTDARWPALLCSLSLAILAALGLRLSAWGLRVVTVLKLLPLLALVALGLGATLAMLGPEPLPQRATVNVGRAALVVVFALQGFEVVPVLAGHSQSGRSVQRATLATLWLCAGLYTLLHLVCAHALSGSTETQSPLSSAARFYAGPTLQRVLDAGQLVSALGIAFGQVVTTPRYLAALGRPDGLGTWIGEPNQEGTPVRALFLTAALICVLVTLGDLQSLFVLSSIAVLSQYCGATLSLLRLSLREQNGWKSALWVWAALSLATSAVLASYATRAELLTTLAVEAFGVVLLVVARAFRARPPA